MITEFEKSVLDYCRKLELIPPGSSLLLAVSGGADSVALMHALKALNDELDCKLYVAHINHNLRGQHSDTDEQFVSRLATKLGMPVETRSVNVSGYAAAKRISVETAARQLRIQSLIDIAESFNCSAIATAHHADDNAETIVHRLARGTGYKGLCGIEPAKRLRSSQRSSLFIRPLLSVNKADIIDYCKSSRLSWRHDHTNEQLCYTRNRIRHQLLPCLEAESAGKLSHKLNQLSAECRRLYERISDQTQQADLFYKDDENTIRIRGSIFKTKSELVQVEILRRGLELIGCGLRNISQTHYKQMISLTDRAGGKMIQLPGKFAAVCEGGDIVLRRNSNNNSENKHFRKEIKIGTTIEYNNFKIKADSFGAESCDLKKFISEKTSNVEWFDFDKLNGQIFVRKRRNGDVFVPIGRTNKQKVGKFLSKNQVNHEIRKKILIFEDNFNIIWVGKIRASDATKVDSSTKRILQISVFEV